MVAGITPPTVGGKIAAGGTVGQLQTYAASLVHGEWTYSASVANATLTPLSAGSNAATTSSSSNVLSAIGTTASGFTAILAGVYTITIRCSIGTLATGRSFVSILNNGSATEYRGFTSADDQMASTAELYLAASTLVTFQFFQTTGATQTITGRFNVSYKGGL